jgi:ribosomal protein S27AE
MLGEHIQSQLLVIRHPNCPKCGAKMYFARLQPEKPDHDRLTYECPQCPYVEMEVVRVH